MNDRSRDRRETKTLNGHMERMLKTRFGSAGVSLRLWVRALRGSFGSTGRAVLDLAPTERKTSIVNCISRSGDEQFSSGRYHRAHPTRGPGSEWPTSNLALFHL